MDRWAWRATVHGIAESDIIEPLSAYTDWFEHLINCPPSPSAPLIRGKGWSLVSLGKTLQTSGKYRNCLFRKRLLALLPVLDFQGSSSVQFSSLAQSCLTPCDPMDYSTPGLPVHHQLLEFTQTHVYWVGDAIQPSHPLLSPSPTTFNLSQHQGQLSKQQFRDTKFSWDFIGFLLGEVFYWDFIGILLGEVFRFELALGAGDRSLGWGLPAEVQPPFHLPALPPPFL